MNQLDIVTQLDEFFGVHSFDEHEIWLPFMDDEHQLLVRPFFVPEFWEGVWNGLMLNNAETIETVYLVVFPSAGVIDTIIAKEVERRGEGAMIFAHHPAAYEENGVGFVQMPAEQLEELAEHRISFYSCHSPLDCHTEVSTANALATALGLNDIQRFGHYVNGEAGIIGTVPSMPFEAIARKLAKVCELPTLRYDQVLHNGQPVERIAIVAGGGGDPQIIDEAQQLGADTYITGHWHLFGDFEYAATQREAFKDYIPNVKMNLIGASHYSTEMVVMRDQMKAWFDDNFELEAILIPQADAWGVSQEE